jgi:hypothetical protein
MGRMREKSLEPFNGTAATETQQIHEGEAAPADTRLPPFPELSEREAA